MTFYGKGEGGFEESLVPNHMRDFKSNILISIYDVWALANLHKELANNRMLWVPYVPVDSLELNPFYIEKLKYAHKIIPMSQHSENELRKHFGDKVLPHIPCGTDPEIFKPLWETEEEKNKLKTALGFTPDTFLITMLGDIKGHRKRWAENIEGVKIFRDRNPTIKLGLYIHTNLRKITGYDFNIQQLIKDCGLEDVTRVVDPYSFVKGISDIEVAKILNSSDVFLQASYGEGFGISFCDAASCGTPSIGTSFTSMPQVIDDGKSGYLVKVLYAQMDQSHSRKAIPEPEDIATKLGWVYTKGSVSFREGCLNHAQKYHWDDILNKQWLPVLDSLEKEFAGYNISPPEPSQILKDRSKEIQIYG
ncbi:MAG: glycosyltransferase [Candidatus Daviesbacteria bacterium]|nr:glycosyltransferase [Candidatus Daviesbacteria bacterium]